MKLVSSPFALASIISASILSLSAQATITRTYQFPPNQPVTIQNPLYWELDAHCAIDSQDIADRLTGFMVHRSGRINGIGLEQGQDMTVTVHPHEELHLQAEYRAVVKITNYGRSTVIAKCEI